MTEKQASTLHVGDHIVFSDGCLGTVTRINRRLHYPILGSADISWADGQEGTVDFRDFENIEYVQPEATR